MNSSPCHDLPLAEFLQLAADKRLTTSIDLHNRLTVGRIEIVDGQITDAKYGGLAAEEAVIAALLSRELNVLEGHKPSRLTPHRVTMSTGQVLREAARRTQPW